jgi:hypothetical protein
MDRLTTPIQESLLTLLTINDKEGGIAASLLNRKHFDQLYVMVAERLIAHHKTHGRSPGLAHLDDLFDDILNNPNHKKLDVIKSVLSGIVQQAASLNVEYIFGRLTTFMRSQMLKQGILQAAQAFEVGGEKAVAAVEEVLVATFKNTVVSLDSGVFLGDTSNTLKFLDDPLKGWSLGIRELDVKGLQPTTGEMLLYIAAKGSGKSWFCVHVAKQAMLHGKKVVHISLEMSQELVIQRYYQSFFAIPKRPVDFSYVDFTKDNYGRLKEVSIKEGSRKVSLESPDIRKRLLGRLGDWGQRFNDIVVKRFPMHSLTVSQLEAYLDQLELRHKFIPNMLIIDYPDLMKIDAANVRVDTGHVYGDIVRVLQERNLAGIIPTQANRLGNSSEQVSSVHTSEDFSKVQKASMVLTYSQTQVERRFGLARLFVDKSRSDEDKFTVLISQSYRTGQYMLKSALMNDNYWDDIKGLFKEGRDNGD